MTVRVLTGSKEEIAQKVVNLPGEVREVIAFVEEPLPTSTHAVTETVEDFFKEMEPYMAEAGDVDYSREAIYRRAGISWSRHSKFVVCGRMTRDL